MKTYIMVILLLSLFSVSYGFAVPALISASDSLAVLFGLFIAVVAAPVALFFIGNKLYKKHIKKDQEK